MDRIYVIQEYREGEGSSLFSHGAFTSKEVAERVLEGMRMFRDADDDSHYYLVALELNSDLTFEDWARRKVGS